MPLGILTLAVALEVLVRFRPFRFLESAVVATWIAGAISTLATVNSAVRRRNERRERWDIGSSAGLARDRGIVGTLSYAIAGPAGPEFGRMPDQQCWLVS